MFQKKKDLILVSQNQWSTKRAQSRVIFINFQQNAPNFPTSFSSLKKIRMSGEQIHTFLKWKKIKKILLQPKQKFSTPKLFR